MNDRAVRDGKIILPAGVSLPDGGEIAIEIPERHSRHPFRSVNRCWNLRGRLRVSRMTCRLSMITMSTAYRRNEDRLRAHTAYFIALLSARDQYAHIARRLTEEALGALLTTAPVLEELCHALSASRTRRTAAAFVALLRSRTDVTVVYPDRERWDLAFALYSS